MAEISLCKAYAQRKRRRGATIKDRENYLCMDNGGYKKVRIISKCNNIHIHTHTQISKAAAYIKSLNCTNTPIFSVYSPVYTRGACVCECEQCLFITL